MTRKFSITGIDGSGKSSAISGVVQELGNKYKIAKIGRPSYVAGKGISGGIKYVYRNFEKNIDEMHEFFDRTNSKIAVASVNALYGFIWPAISRNIIEKYEPEIAIYGRDMIIDPAVYSTFYFPLSEKINSKKRLKIAKIIINPEMADCIIYYDIDPSVAIERIEKRIIDENIWQSSVRKKWRHMHENKKDLGKLREQYENTLEVMVSTYGKPVYVLDVTSKNRVDVIKETAGIIRKEMSDI